MKPVVKTPLVLLLAAMLVAACSSAPEIQHKPYNDADSQRSRASQAQDELSSESPTRE